MRTLDNIIEEAGSRPIGSDCSDLISEPPCKTCLYFKPITENEENIEDRGLVICHADEMYLDFSCYRTNFHLPKQDPNQLALPLEKDSVDL